MMGPVFLFQLIVCFCLAGATAGIMGTTTYCGDSEIFCLENEITFQCNTTRPFLEWYLHRYKTELDFSSLDNIGQNESELGFTATLTGKDESGNLMSTLTFTLDLEYNNTDVTCSDGFTGQQQTCTIIIEGKADMPNHVIEHKQNKTSLGIFWNPPSFTGGVGIPINNYSITVSPPPSTGICRSGQCIVNGTSITFDGLKKCSSFEISIASINCNGVGSPFILSIVSKLPGKVLNYKKIDNNPIKLDWSMPEDSGGENILYYRVCSPDVCWSTMNSSIILNLTNGEYNLSIIAYNCHGPGDPVFITITVGNNFIFETVTGSAVALIVILLIIMVLVIIAAVFFHFMCRKKKLIEEKYVPIQGDDYPDQSDADEDFVTLSVKINAVSDSWPV